MANCRWRRTLLSQDQKPGFCHNLCLGVLIYRKNPVSFTPRSNQKPGFYHNICFPVLINCFDIFGGDAP
ncbi:MAG: hypothetical protein EAZ79_07720 [Oscillatoriales cyanobacterium]|nr:MAG: hypothetical protein EAZ79_07720 [Oscillatoriales cyanobacterium]